jgi:hypothetical protein
VADAWNSTVVVAELADVPVFRTVTVREPLGQEVDASFCVTNGNPPSPSDMTNLLMRPGRVSRQTQGRHKQRQMTRPRTLQGSVGAQLADRADLFGLD